MNKEIPFEEQRETSILLPAAFSSGKWGYINTEGEVVLEPRFDDAWGFAEGIAVVRYKGKFGAINQKGEFVIEPKFFELSGPSEGLLIFARRKNKYGYMDTRGNVVIKPTFYAAYHFNEGRAFVRLNKSVRTYTFFNPEFFKDPTVPFFSDYRKFPLKQIRKRRELPMLSRIQETGFIDREGNLIAKGYFYPPAYLPSYSFMNFSEGFAAVRVKTFINGELSQPQGFYINRDGEFVFGPFDDVHPFSEGYACVEVDNAHGFINTRGEFVLEPYFGYNPARLRFSNGLIPVLFDVRKRYILNDTPPDYTENPHRYKWGYLNKKFQAAIYPAFDEVEAFSEGLAAVKVGEKWGYIDTLGRWVIRPGFDEAYEFFDGIAGAVLKGKDVYINRQGKIIWPPEDELLVN